MSIEVLQKKIRKLKNPTVLWLDPTPELIPAAVMEETDSPAQACGVYCRELMEALAQTVPAVRVNFDAFALLGPEGLVQLKEVLNAANKLGYYVILDWMHLEEPAVAEQAARRILSGEAWKCDAVAVCAYGGSDCVKPYISAAGKKAVFVSVKTGNRSGSELQDLQTGGRQVYTATADLVSRWGEAAMERCGYSRVAAVAGAANAASLRTLRGNFSDLFLLVEGIETPSANAKNCSYAFDRLGHGAACCAGSIILGAWREEEREDYVAAAKDAAEHLKRKLTRYVTIL